MKISSHPQLILFALILLLFANMVTAADRVANANSDEVTIWNATSSGGIFNDVHDNKQIRPVNMAGTTTMNIGGRTVYAGQFNGGNSHSINTSATTAPKVDGTGSGFSLEFWFNLTGISGTPQILGAIQTDGGDGYAVQIYDLGAYNAVQLAINGGGKIVSTGNIEDDTVYHMVVVNNGTTGKEIWINGVLNNTATDTTQPNANAQFGLGSWGSVQWLNGLIHEARYYNASLNASAIDALYNAGVATNGIPLNQLMSAAPPAPPSTTSLIVTAEDIQTGVSIQNITVHVTNSTHNFTNATTTGEVRFGDMANLTTVNVTVESNFSGGYFTQTRPVSILLETSYSSDLWQHVSTYTAIADWTNASIANFGINFDIFFNETSTGTVLYHQTAGNSSGFANSTEWIKKQFSVNVTPLSTSSHQLTLVNTSINVSAFILTNGAPVSTFNINLTNQDTGEQRQYATSNGLIQIGLVGDNWNATVFGPAIATTSFSPNGTQTYENYTIGSYVFNSVHFQFLDVVTLDGVTNISLELISDLYSGNFTTTSGNISIELLEPETYVARFTSLPDYSEHLYKFTLTNGSFVDLTFYMLNTTLATITTGTVIDETASAVEGAQIHVMRYNLQLNDYVTTEVLTTNNAGQAEFLTSQSDEFYKFAIFYQGDLKLITQPSYVFSTTLNFQISTTSSTAESFFKEQSIQGYLVFNDATNNFRLTYVDEDAVTTQGCLTIYSLGYNGDVQINQSCLSTSGGTILLPVAAVNGSTYGADATVTINGQSRFLASTIKDFTTPSNLGVMGGFVVLLIAGAMAFLGRWHFQIPLIGIPVWLLISRKLGLLAIPTEAVIAGIVLTIVIIVLLARGRTD